LKCHKGTTNFCLHPIQAAQKAEEASASEKEKERVNTFYLLSILRAEVLLCLCSLQGVQLPQPCAAAGDASRGWEGAVKPMAPRHASARGGNREMAAASS